MLSAILPRFLAERLALLALRPRSWCSECARPFYSDRRRPCRCGATARTFTRSARDGRTTVDKAS